MNTQEFINECNEFLSNIEWKNSSFNGRSLPENTYTELGDGQNRVWQQGIETNLSNTGVVRSVLNWTDWDGSDAVLQMALEAYNHGGDYNLPFEWKS